MVHGGQINYTPLTRLLLVYVFLVLVDLMLIKVLTMFGKVNGVRLIGTYITGGSFNSVCTRYIQKKEI